MSAQYMMGFWPDLSAEPDHQFTFDLGWKFIKNDHGPSIWSLGLSEPAQQDTSILLRTFTPVKQRYDYGYHERMVTPTLFLSVYILYLIYVYKDNSYHLSKRRRVINLVFKLTIKLILYGYLLHLHLNNPVNFHYQALCVLALSFPSNVQALWVVYCNMCCSRKHKGLQSLKSFQIHVTQRDRFLEAPSEAKFTSAPIVPIPSLSSIPEELTQEETHKVVLGSSHSDKNIDEGKRKPLCSRSLESAASSNVDTQVPMELNSRPEAEKMRNTESNVDMDDDDHLPEAPNPSGDTAAPTSIISTVGPMMFTAGMLIAPIQTKMAAHLMTAGFVAYPMAVAAKNKLVSFVSEGHEEGNGE